MKLTEKQLKQLETALEKRGYRKYVCKFDYDRRVHDYSSVCSNESWHWYKTIEKEREEDKYGDMKTKHAVFLYIAFWDYTKYPEEVQQNIWVAGTQVVVKVCDETYCNSFEFPFYHDRDEDNLFYDYDPEGERDCYSEREVSDSEIERLITNLEILAVECSAFFRKEAKFIIDRKLRDDHRPT